MPKTLVLLTDYGLSDPYVGVIHGVIHSISPETPIIDLTHNCLPQNIAQAAYFLSTSYSFFPKGTIFVSVVDPGVGTSRKIICLKTKKYYFLAPDNGLLSLVYLKEGGVIRSVNNRRLFLKAVSTTFHGRDIFAPVAAHLSRKNVFPDLGPVISGLIQLRDLQPISSKGKVIGRILFFDHFGNAISNIHKKEVPPQKLNKAKVQCGRFFLGVPGSHYQQGRNLTALWNSSDTLEIAKPLGAAAKQIKLGETVILTYEK